MLKKIHVRMTFFCSLAIAGILLIMTVFCLIFSEKSIRSSHYAGFQNDCGSLLSYIDSQTVFSHTWLSRIEHSYQMIVDIEDGGKSLLYGSLHAHDTYASLLTLIRETAEKEYHLTSENTGNLPVLPQKCSFSVYDDAQKEYYATAAIIPKNNSYLSVILLASAEPSGNQILLQRLYFGFGALVSWILLTVCAWFFIRHMLHPIEENRRKQNEFISAASHELRSPLTVMLSSLSSARIALPQEQDHFFDVIESEGQRMARLIQDMLLINSDRHSWTIHPDDVEPDTLLLDTFEKYEALAKEKGLHLEVSLPDSPLSSCRCDRERISQVLSILIDNAFSYTPRGGSVMLSLSATRKACSFTVSDNGPGIPNAKKAKVFDRFYRADTSRHDREHFGMGLCIAREILILHKGTIHVEDSPEGGCAFVVTLPWTL